MSEQYAFMGGGFSRLPTHLPCRRLRRLEALEIEVLALRGMNYSHDRRG